jgi:acyl-coenzyme A thioesterase PaaI-like protein
VISAVLDAMGSLAVMAALGAKHMDELPAKRLERFARHSTIDLRIDFLRPGIGDQFVIHAEAVRVGARVGNARMEFRAADGKLLSTGTAAYLTS